MIYQAVTILCAAIFSFLFVPISRKNRTFNSLFFLSTFSFFLTVCFLIFKSHKISSYLITAMNTVSISILIALISFRFIQSKKVAFASTLFFCVASALWWFGFLDPIFLHTKQYHFKVGTSDLSLYVLLQACAVLSFSVWGAYLVSNWFESFLKKSAFQESMQILFSKFFKIFAFFLSFLWGLSLVGVDISVFAFFGGTIALGIGFGLQNIVSNLLCGVILLLDRSIKPNDVIVLNDGKVVGVVNKLTARYVMLRTQDGKEHLVPNDYFVKNKVENWSYSDRLIRIDFALKIPFERDLDEIKDILYEAATYEERVMKTPPPSVRYTKFAENAIEVQLRVWINDPAKGVSEVRSNLIYAVWKLFKEKEIQIPYNPIDVCIRQELNKI